MGSGKAIKKKVQSCCDSCNSQEAISHQLHQRVALKFYLKNIYQELHFHAFCKISYSANISITVFCTLQYYRNFIQLMKGLTKTLLYVKGMKNSIAAGYSFISEIHSQNSWL